MWKSARSGFYATVNYSSWFLVKNRASQNSEFSMSNVRAKAHSYFYGLKFVYRSKYVAFLRGVADTSVTGSGSFFV